MALHFLYSQIQRHRCWDHHLENGLYFCIFHIAEGGVPEREALSEELFAKLWTEVVGRDTPVEWLFNYLDLLCDVLYFTCHQVNYETTI